MFVPLGPGPVAAATAAKLEQVDYDVDNFLGQSDVRLYCPMLYGRAFRARALRPRCRPPTGCKVQVDQVGAIGFACL